LAIVFLLCGACWWINALCVVCLFVPGKPRRAWLCDVFTVCAAVFLSRQKKSFSYEKTFFPYEEMIL
jgi:hypothetical protein